MTVVTSVFNKAASRMARYGPFSTVHQVLFYVVSDCIYNRWEF